MASPPVPVSANQGDAQRPREPSRIYKAIMTPVLFTSFLVSLLLVDLRHSALRAHYHPVSHSERASRLLPRWLHRVVYRYQPYRYGGSNSASASGSGSGFGSGSGSGAESPSPGPSPALSSGGTVGLGGLGGGEAEDYYHSKQRKLMRMEAEEAFEMRGTVVAVLGVVSLGVLWAVWRAVVWGVGAAGRVWVS